MGAGGLCGEAELPDSGSSSQSGVPGRLPDSLSSSLLLPVGLLKTLLVVG